MSTNSRWWTAAILKIALLLCQPWIIPIRSNLVCRYENSFPGWTFDKKKSKFCKLKIADGRHYWKSTLTVSWSWRYVGRLMRNLDHRWRSTCRYRSRDQNGNFRKFKMAGDRHFQNSLIFISQWRIIRFRLNLIRRCEFRFRGWSFERNRNFANWTWRSDAILIFFLYFGAVLTDAGEIWTADVTKLVPKTAIFKKSRWRLTFRK